MSAFPRGTRVGDVVSLTEAEALYERDLGRIAPLSAEAEGPAAAEAPAKGE